MAETPPAGSRFWRAARRVAVLAAMAIVFFPEAARRFAAHEAGSLDYKVSGSAWKAFGDSALIATLATFFSVVFGTLAAYSIARYRTGGDNYPFQFLTIRMFP